MLDAGCSILAPFLSPFALRPSLFALLFPASGVENYNPGMDSATPAPLVSVLVATYNAALTLRRCIDSVVGQQGIGVELLIADGQSSDDTVDICQIYAAKLAYFQSRPDAGVYDAWNRLLPHARGRWICFLGADDCFPEVDTLARLAEAADERPADCRLVYGRVQYYDAAGDRVYEEGAPWEASVSEMRFCNSIPHIGTLHAREIFDEGARFDPAYRIAGDYDLVRREALQNGAFFAEEVVAAHAAWGGLSTRADLELQSVREVGRIIRRQDGRHPPAVWYWRCGKVLVRHAIYSAFGQRGLERYERWKSIVRRKKRVLRTEY